MSFKMSQRKKKIATHISDIISKRSTPNRSIAKLPEQTLQTSHAQNNIVLLPEIQQVISDNTTRINNLEIQLSELILPKTTIDANQYSFLNLQLQNLTSKDVAIEGHISNLLTKDLSIDEQIATINTVITNCNTKLLTIDTNNILTNTQISNIIKDILEIKNNLKTTETNMVEICKAINRMAGQIIVSVS